MDYRIREAAALIGVSDDTLRRWVDSGRVDSSTDESGRRVVAGSALAELAVELAEPVELPGHAAPTPRSARNSFTGIVTRVVRDTVMAQVEMQAGPHRVVSLISREAADELGLEPGVLAVASIKATNVVVETPRRA
ncbi:helix-turn-helix transcriptional regulator [Luteococcus sanguinis]|uniref:Helix-turn-helix transcriptional regulator n=1 Tax=Luteococcus sanguinis TaxID=174038 RepID=A0ABW1X562_9ACTN